MNIENDNNSETRRSFIKTSLLGSLFLSTGLFTWSCDSSEDEKKEIVKASVAAQSLETDDDWLKIRNLFNLKNDRTFLNTASIGPTYHSVEEQIISTMRLLNSKITTGHSMVGSVRSKIAKFLNADTTEVAITRNSTEGMNIIAQNLSLKKGDEIILSSHEHIGGAAPWLALKEQLGFTIKVIDISNKNGDVLKTLKDAFTPRTKALSVSHILCTTGEILPVKQIVNLCKEYNIISCIDGAQALGMIPTDLADIDPDFYTTCGHKWLFGPEGSGILYVNKNRLPSCKSHYMGAYSDSEFNLQKQKMVLVKSASRMEYGTRNTPLIIGLGEAVDVATTIGVEKIAKRGKELADYFLEKISSIKNIKIITPLSENAYCSIITIKIKGKDNLNISKQLNDKALFIRGIYENDLNALRVSFSIYNTKNEINLLIKELKEKVL